MLELSSSACTRKKSREAGRNKELHADVDKSDQSRFLGNVPYNPPSLRLGLESRLITNVLKGFPRNREVLNSPSSLKCYPLRLVQDGTVK